MPRVDSADGRGTPLLYRAGERLLGSRTGGNSAMIMSSVALIAARVAASGLGFLAWLVAARLFTPAEVGIAAGAVAAMMLGVQLALGGTGSAIVALYPHERARRSHLFDSGALVVGFLALVVSGLFLVLAGTLLRELAIVAGDVRLAAVFVAMTLFGTLNTLYDYVSVAMRRGDHVLVRNVVFGLVALGALAASVPAGLDGPFAILLAWAAAGLAACLLAWAQLWASTGYRLAGRFTTGLARRMVSTGIPNWLLSLTERAPALVLPILVTELLSPEDNAFWYAAWMMAWVVLIIPTSVGQSIFAEAVHRPREVREVVRHGVVTAFLLGAAAAIGMAVLATFALDLLGPRYGAAGSAPLRILVISVLPFTVVQAYFAVSRARGRLREAIVTGALAAVIGTLAAIIAGMAGGLVPMAIAWVAVQLLVGTWAGIRLLRLRGGAVSREADAAPMAT